MKLIIILFAIHLCYNLASGLECKGPHEHLWENTPLCPLQCDNLHKMNCMALSHTPSCQCRDGTVRDTKNNKCVYLNECPEYYKSKIECNAQNEVAAEVVSACPKTCSHPVGPLCQALIHKPSCVCSEGTVRDTVNSKCVRLEECPKQENQTIEYSQTKAEDTPKLVCNGDNEKYSDWISACPDVCPHTGIPLPSKCLAIVEKPSCICVNGTIRDTIKNKCVPRVQCTPVPYSQTKAEDKPTSPKLVCDGPNEKYSDWISACPDVCPHTGIQMITTAPPSKCMAIVEKPSCICINGTIRDTIQNKCVTRDQCIPVPFNDDQMKCNGENERLSRLTTCQPSCQIPWIAKCDMVPSDQPLCVCIPGTIRDSITAKCVHLKDCQKKIIN